MAQERSPEHVFDQGGSCINCGKVKAYCDHFGDECTLDFANDQTLIDRNYFLRSIRVVSAYSLVFLLKKSTVWDEITDNSRKNIEACLQKLRSSIIEISSAEQIAGIETNPISDEARSTLARFIGVIENKSVVINLASDLIHSIVQIRKNNNSFRDQTTKIESLFLFDEKERSSLNLDDMNSDDILLYIKHGIYFKSAKKDISKNTDTLEINILGIDSKIIRWIYNRKVRIFMATPLTAMPIIVLGEIYQIEFSLILFSIFLPFVVLFVFSAIFDRFMERKPIDFFNIPLIDISKKILEFKNPYNNKNKNKKILIFFLSFIVVGSLTGSIILTFQIQISNIIFIPILILLLETTRRIFVRIFLHKNKIETNNPIVLLRGFDSDETKVRLGGTSFFGYAPNLEEIMSGLVESFGEFVAVGNPNDSMLPMGAERFYIEEDNWQDLVRRTMIDARLLFFLVGKGDWLGWEFEEAVKFRLLDKACIVLPPADDQFIEDYWINFIAKIDDAKLVSKLLKIDLEDTLCVFWFDDSSIIAVKANEKSVENYLISLKIFLYANFVGKEIVTKTEN